MGPQLIEQLRHCLRGSKLDLRGPRNGFKLPTYQASSGGSAPYCAPKPMVAMIQAGRRAVDSFFVGGNVEMCWAPAWG
eukprot:7950970-Alexandrium_andersonii.AAC.1